MTTIDRWRLPSESWAPTVTMLRVWRPHSPGLSCWRVAGKRRKGGKYQIVISARDCAGVVERASQLMGPVAWAIYLHAESWHVGGPQVDDN